MCDVSEALRTLQEGHYDACVLNCSRAAISALHEFIANERAPLITIVRKASLRDAAGQSPQPSPAGEVNMQLLQHAIHTALAHAGEPEKTQRGEMRFWAKFLDESAAVALIDAEGRFLVANDAFCRMFGYDQQDIKELELLKLAHPEDVEKNQRAFGRILSGPNAQFQQEIRCLHKNGAWMQVRQSLIGLMGPEKSSRGFALLALEELPARDDSLEPEPDWEFQRIMSSQVFDGHESERKLIAQELHDSLGASLAAIKYSLEKTIGQFEKQRGRRTSLGEVIPLVQNAIEETRRISTNLWPSILDDLGIIATVNSLCCEFEKTYSSIKIERRVQALEHDIPAHLKVIIYRIVQEALNNVAKHSGATLVRLSILETHESIELMISDNGRGLQRLDASKVGDAGGMGLFSMKRRAEFSGGAFSFDARAGEGACVRVSWPRQ
jgi:PAS domain S-box-containing protein